MRLVHAVGIDIIEIARIEEAIARWGGRFLGRVYTEAELAYCRGRISELAARFAGKEAIMKALGTGNRGVAWREIEILPVRGGRPTVTLYRRARERAEKLGLSGLAISLSHSKSLAVASAIGEAS
ncbi:MAG: holo-ACP synthase [Chloroflexi bacterium]|nr:holo-ACP synthase [Chloroflexota bacterium]